MRYVGEYFGDGKALANHACGHDESPAWSQLRFKAGIDGGGHTRGIFEPAFACNGIGAAGVDDDGSEAFATTVVEYFAADNNRGSLKLVLREHSRA